MERAPHYIRKTVTSDYPQQAIWFDTETRMTKDNVDTTDPSAVKWYETVTELKTDVGDTVYHYLKFGYACYMRAHHNNVWGDEDWLYYTTRKQFWDWVVSKVRKKTKLYMFCHNTSFDLPVLDVFAELVERGFVLRSAIIDAPPTILKYRRGDEAITIIDTLNIWRHSLDKLGKEIGLPKLEMPANADDRIAWESYGKRDVEIIRKALLDWWTFLASNDFGSFCPTLASQSMRVYRQRFYDKRIFIDTDERCLKLTRAGYYGGRVECFFIGRFYGDFYLLDVNSMYPYVMAEQKYPTKCVSFTSYADVRDIQNWLSSYCVTAHVKLRTNKPFAPVRHDGKLVFPTGTFDCILSTEELRYALHNAEILSVYCASVYEKDILFRDFVLDFYSRRQQCISAGNEIEAYRFKILLNSFYGKWGQSGGKWMEVDQHPDYKLHTWIDYDVDTDTAVRWRQLGHLRQTKSEEPESYESFPAIAGHVTANARMVLWQLIESAGIQNTFYCDTDSLLINRIGLDALLSRMDETRLGALKLVSTHKDIELHGAKDAVFDTKVINKGVRINALWESRNSIIQSKWTGLRGLLQSGNATRPTTETIRKHLARIYGKGSVQPSGLVLPLDGSVFPPLNLWDVDQDAGISGAA